ncbi:Transcriptional regulator, AbiEi antitoxin, Type IV TA system [Amycolatopsis marina]|uniref:Transcriptional regulator, AbiEi antitoxin, Type IV TA system n=2 Tax=Amycolatopsis marina TaxID=490629 RepID=A0A1I0ZS99_9PSEU|nr:Transcriptional regulator, AbiEi antitoxin, Type IV TA system [Amycolatopsis marina]
MGDVRESDGLILRDNALHAGVDPDQIMKALRTGRLRRLQRGIYICRADEVTPLALARAAVLTTGIADAVASHHTAARVHGIPLPDGRGPEHVTVARTQRRIRRKELVFHSREMDLGDVDVHRGVPVTRPPRTLIDLLPVIEETAAVWAVDDSLRRRLVGRTELLTALDARPGAPGDALARTRVLSADGKAESLLETAGRLALRNSEVPLPEAQYRVVAHDGSVFYLDGAYPEHMVGLEFDGQGVHSEPEALYRDRWRQNLLVAEGWTILRFTWWDIMHGKARFVASVRSALGMTAP